MDPTWTFQWTADVADRPPGLYTIHLEAANAQLSDTAQGEITLGVGTPCDAPCMMVGAPAEDAPMGAAALLGVLAVGLARFSRLSKMD